MRGQLVQSCKRTCAPFNHSSSVHTVKVITLRIYRNQTDLINKRLVEKVRPSDTEIEDVDLLQDGIVEGIQEPGGVGYLVVGEHAEDVEVSVGCKPKALGGTGDDACDKGAVAESVLEAFLVSPV